MAFAIDDDKHTHVYIQDFVSTTSDCTALADLFADMNNEALADHDLLLSSR